MVKKDSLFLGQFNSLIKTNFPFSLSVSQLFVAVEENKVSIILPQNNDYLYSATLYFENNLPASLTYFDKNGTPKVNIIYNEFKSGKS